MCHFASRYAVVACNRLIRNRKVGCYENDRPTALATLTGSSPREKSATCGSPLPASRLQLTHHLADRLEALLGLRSSTFACTGNANNSTFSAPRRYTAANAALDWTDATLVGAASGPGQFPAERRSPNGWAPGTSRRRPFQIEESSSPMARMPARQRRPPQEPSVALHVEPTTLSTPRAWAKPQSPNSGASKGRPSRS
jgi:hypothetical protein